MPEPADRLLPRSLRPPQAAMPGLPPPPGTVLLVEDSRHAAEAVRLLARRIGLRLRRAETLCAARRHLQVYRPDVVLVDLGLPDGCGTGLVAELVQGRMRRPRVVAISADPGQLRRAQAVGADACVEKPLRLPDDLRDLLGPRLAPRVPVGAVRTAAIDPLALRDDLARARRALAEDRHAYALGFLGGLARCTGDPDLGEAAQQAGATGQTEALHALIERRSRANRLPLL